MNQAINQNNLVDIIKSMTKESEAVVNMINSVAAKLASVKAIDKKQAENVKKSIVFIGEYLGDISKIVSNIKTIGDDSIDEKSINKIAGIISSISKLFKDVSQIDINVNGIMNFKFKLNVIVPFILKSITKDLAKSLTDLNTSVEDDLKKINETFQKGYITNISNLFDSVNSLNNIEFPNLIKLQANLYIFKRYLPDIISYINNLFEENKQTLISKKRTDAIINTIDNIKHISNEISEINKILIKEIAINNTKVLKLLETKNNPFDILIAVVLKIYEFSDKLDKKLGNQQLNTQKLNDIKTYVDSLRDFTKNIKSLVLDIVVIGLLLPILIVAVPTAIISISLISLFLWSTTFILSSNPGMLLSKELKDLTKSILMLALSMASITITLVIMAMTGPIIMKSIGQVALTFLAVIVALALIVGLLWVMSKTGIFLMATTGSVKLMVAVLTICGSMIAVALTLVVAGLLADLALPAIPSFLKLFGVTLIVLIAAVGLALVASFLAAPIFVGLAAVVLSVGALMLMSFMLTKLSKITPPNEDKLVGEKDGVVTKIKNIVSKIFKLLRGDGGITAAGSGDRSLIGGLIHLLSPGLYGVIDSLMVFGTLLTTVLSVGAIMLIGDMLKSIESIDLDPGKIKDKVKNIVDCVRTLVNAVTTEREMKQGDRGFLGSLINWLNPGLANMVDAISSMFVLGISIISVGALTFIAKELNSIQNIGLNKNTLVGEDGKSGKVAMIMSTADAVISAIAGQESDLNKKTIKDATKKVKNVESVVKNLHDINEHLIKIYSENIPYKTGELPGVMRLLLDKDFELIISNISNNKYLTNNAVSKSKYYKKILKNIYGDLPNLNLSNEFTKNSIDITDNYIRFVEKISNTDINKLETSVRMFEKMAEFSKSINGNFEKLAESLNEDLMPVLEELKETLNKIPEKIDTNAASVSQSVAAYAAPAVGPSTQYGMTAQVQRENPNMSKEDVQKVVDKRLNEQARAQAQSLESKFEELIELLKSGMVRVDLM